MKTFENQAHQGDDLRFVRGILLGAAIGVIFWLAVAAAAVHWLF